MEALLIVHQELSESLIWAEVINTRIGNIKT